MTAYDIITRDEAFEILDEEDGRFVIMVDEMDAYHLIDRDRFGSLVLNTRVSPIGERRTLRVTREQAERAIIWGQDQEDGLKMVLREESDLTRD